MSEVFKNQTEKNFKERIRNIYFYMEDFQTMEME